MKQLVVIWIGLIAVNLHGQERYISVDGSKIWINTAGIEDRQEGQPVVVFESGYGTPMDHWGKVLDGVSSFAPFVTYDRPGIGKSEFIDEMPTVQNVANRLVKILRKLEIAPPYILVGHSLGGVYVRGFANLYSNMLAGLVFVDPADFTESYENQKAYYESLEWQDARIDSLINSMIQKRHKRHDAAPTAIRREGQVLEQLRADEFSSLIQSELPNIPVHFLIGGRFDLPKNLRSKNYDDEAIFRSKLKHRMERWTEIVQTVDKGMLLYSGDAGHFVHYDDPELFISSIRIILHDFRLQRVDEE